MHNALSKTTNSVRNFAMENGGRIIKMSTVNDGPFAKASEWKKSSRLIVKFDNGDTAQIDIIQGASETRFSVHSDVGSAMFDDSNDVQGEARAVYDAWHDSDGSAKPGYMLAPNGKPTNLTERQWIQVRTPAFKRWFGDWESLAETAYMRIVKSVSEAVQAIRDAGLLNQDIFNYKLGIKARISGANLSKMESEKATSKSVSPRLHALAVANVDKLFASASIEMKHPDTHGRNEVEGIRRIGTVMRDPDDGLFVPVMLTVVEYRQYGKKIYTVETVDVGKYKNPAGQLADSPTNGDTQAPIAEFVSKIAKLAEEVNHSDVSKVVDDNGEPKVFYHGTFENWTEYDLQKNVNQMWGNGIYLTPYPERARLYGDNIMAFYVKADTDYRTAKTTGKQKDYTVIKQTEDIIVYSPNQIKSATDNTGAFDEEDPDIRYSLVTDEAKIKELEEGDTMKVYRAMQLVDGKLYPPMSGKVNGKWREPIQLGKWEQSEERPDLIGKDGKFKLNKGNGSTIGAAYNPYFHTSTSPLNDQFSSAYKRPELVTVEVEIPVSELTSGYKAKGAKDAVGKVDWHSGSTTASLGGRDVYLSRYDKPIRIVPESEVAKVIAERARGKNITFKTNTVTPKLKDALKAEGLRFDDDIRYSIVTDGLYDEEKKNLRDAQTEAQSVLDRIGGTEIGHYINEDFRREGRSTLIGKRVSSARDLAALAQIYRNPCFETFRYFFTKNGEVVWQTGVTARLPGVTNVSVKTPDGGTYGEIERMAAKLKPDSVWLLHNHPSGNVAPSQQDIDATGELREYFDRLGIALSGHVIIDHDTYAELDKWGNYRPRRIDADMLEASYHGVPFTNRLRERGEPFNLGTIAAYAMKLQRDTSQPGKVLTLISLDNSGEFVTAVADIPAESIADSDSYIGSRYMKLDGFFADWRGASGGGNLFVVGDQDVGKYPAAVQRVLRRQIGIGNAKDFLFSDDGVEWDSVMHRGGVMPRQSEKNALISSRSETSDDGQKRFSIGGVYTGSAADYEKPSLHYVGTGEGNQVYGWGLYGSNQRGVAETYASMSARKEVVVVDGKEMRTNEWANHPKGSPEWIALGAVEFGDRNFNKERIIEQILNSEFYAEFTQEQRNAAIEYLRSHEFGRKKRSENIYKQTFFTDRAPGDESNLLKWYEPVSEENVKRVMSQYAKENVGADILVKTPSGTITVDDFESRAEFNAARNEVLEGLKADGHSLYNYLSKVIGSPKAASEFLARAGIDGVKYPVDSYGKTVKDGDEAGWNYVSFRDDNIRVDHKWTDGQKRFSVTAADDSAYMDAVNRGDMETAQRMVREAAAKAMPDTKAVDENGDPLVVYHSTDADFTKFDRARLGENTDLNAGDESARRMARLGFWFNEKNLREKLYQNRAIAAYANVNNPYETTFDQLWDILSETSHEEFLDDLKKDGYDGIILEDSEFGGKSFVMFDPEQIKSADPVTYDDAGNVIPLSQRFNRKNTDIRYSVQSMSQLGEQANAAIRELSTGKDAVIHNSYGDITYGIGETGKLTANGRIKGGWGLMHIVYSRMAKDGATLNDALDIAMLVADALENGTESEVRHNKHYYQKDGIEAVFAINQDTSKPVLTGYRIREDESDGAILASHDLRTIPPPRKEDVVASLAKRIALLSNEGQASRFSVSSADQFDGKVQPWPENFPKVMLQTTLANIKQKWPKLHEAANAGSNEAALKLVQNILGDERIGKKANPKWEKLRALAEAHPGAIVVPVHAEEATGRNRIPAQYAVMIKKITGLPVGIDIVQSVRAHHTGANASDRMTRRAAFDGPVERGAEYLLVDDHVTQGGTLNELRKYIQSHGGKVVAVTTLTASQFSDTLAISRDAVLGLYAKFGNKLDEELQTAGIANGVAELTQSQARELLKLRVDTFRDRIAQARLARQRALGAKAVGLAGRARKIIERADNVGTFGEDEAGIRHSIGGLYTGTAVDRYGIGLAKNVISEEQNRDIQNLYIQASQNIPMLKDIAYRLCAKSVMGTASFRLPNREENDLQVKKRDKIIEKANLLYGGDVSQVVDIIAATVTLSPEDSYIDTLSSIDSETG